MRTPVRLAIAGAGSRGTVYAQYASEHPDRARVVAVAEPRAAYRQRLAARHGLDAAHAYADWEEMAAARPAADAVVIATQDAMHVEPAQRFAALGYHLLLEKPMAPDEPGCRAIHAAVKGTGVMCAVCHVLRYTPYTRQLKALLDAGAVGEIVSLQHLEPVGYWHQAHSFVRGNWRSERESSPMLLAKSCHDIDWLSHIVGQPCLRVSSFGSLQHFRPERKPPAAGAATRCVDCSHEPQCPYSALRIYLGRLAQGHSGWPVDVLASEVTVDTIVQALRTGPYGRCVYACDNDVVDHQVVNLEYAGGATAAFTMTAFTRSRDRETHIFGTSGEIYGDGATIQRFDFRTERLETVDTRRAESSALAGHGGGDAGLMEAFVTAVAEDRPEALLSGVDASLESHRIVFAAERSRRTGETVTL